MPSNKSSRLLPLAGSFILGALCMSFLGGMIVNAQTSKKVRKFEYAFTQVGVTRQVLNEFGNDGWEVFAMDFSTGQGIMKKEK